MIQQATLFDLGDIPTSVRRQPTGGSGNPIVFHDYESYVAKFQNKEKTTDDTYTPRDVYEAVLEYVRSIYPMEGKEVLRPFFPGGDYRHAIYPDDGVVVDNPPFSIFIKICKFYSAARIPFFLFGPGLTIFSVLKYCSVVVINDQIEFDNGAKVQCNFATNLIGDTLVTTAPALGNAIARCKSQTAKAKLPKYIYPPEVLSASDFQCIARDDEVFSIKKSEAMVIRDLDCFPKRGGLFGDHLLVSEAAAKAAAKAAEKARNVIPIRLSPRERMLVERLNKNNT